MIWKQVLDERALDDIKAKKEADEIGKKQEYDRERSERLKNIKFEYEKMRSLKNVS